MVHLLPNILSGILAFRDIDQKMRKLYSIERDIKQFYVNTGYSIEEIRYLYRPKYGETLSEINKKYYNEGKNVFNFFKIQDDIIKICDKYNFEYDDKPLSDEISTLFFIGSIREVSKNFYLTSDKNFDMYVNIKSKIDWWGLRTPGYVMTVCTFLTYKGDDEKMFQEIREIGGILYYHTDLNVFLSKIDKLSIKDMIRYNIQKYDKEIRIDKEYNLSTRQGNLSLLREYSL